MLDDDQCGAAVGDGTAHGRDDLADVVGAPHVRHEHALGAEVVRVRLTEVRDEVVHAELVLSTGARVDARASDAVVVALRADAPVLGSPAVLADAGMPARTGEEDAGQERAVEGFRDFLDTVRPEDFA